MDITLKRIDTMSDEELELAIEACFDEAPERRQLGRLEILLEAQFYRTERYRRIEEKAQGKRDGIETERWRIDLMYERWILFLIVGEILASVILFIIGGCQQSAEAKRQIEAVGKVKDELSVLEGSSKATKDSIENLNQKLQLELDLYYEPSVRFSYIPEQKRHYVKIENFGRTLITVFASSVEKRFCALGHPVPVPSNQPILLDGETIVTRLYGQAGGRNVIFYFKAEDGKEYETRAYAERKPVEEEGSLIRGPVTVRKNWDQEMAKRVDRMCPQ